MNARVLRIELRRSAAGWAAAVALLLGFAWPKVAEGMTRAMGEQRSILTNLVPLAMGVGAWQPRRDRRSRTGELLATTSRPEWQRLLHPAVALGLAAVAGGLAVLGGLVMYGLVIGAYIPAHAAVAGLTSALCLAAGVWLGLAVGRMAPWALVPPLLVVGGFVALVTLWFMTDAEGYAPREPPGTLLLFPLSSTGFYRFERLTTEALLAQLACVAGLAGAFLILGVARRFPVAVVPAWAGLALALALLPESQLDAITPDQGALALVCDDEEPRVCARRAHPYVLDDLRRPGRQALDLLAARLPQAPTMVVEVASGYDLPTADLDPRADVLYVETSTDGTGHLDGSPDDLLWTLLAGAGTLPCPEGMVGGDARYNAARVVAAAWLLEEEPPPPPDDGDPAQPDASFTAAAYHTLFGFPPEEQRSRVAALREAELSCDGSDRLEILVGEGRAPAPVP